jgi:hypothetical protein
VLGGSMHMKIVYIGKASNWFNRETCD